MKSIFKFSAVIIVGIAVTLSGFYIGYFLYAPKAELNKKPNSELEINSFPIESNEPVGNIIEPKISASTKMVYEYYYQNDDRIDVVEDAPPYFLIDKTQKDLEKDFNDWQVKSFNSKEIVLRKYIEGESNQHYVIGEYDGYVAVFYKKEINGNNLKDITDTPLKSLNIEEQNKLKAGIEVTGNDELIKVMENYES